MLLGALKFVANRDKFNISKDAYVEGEVGIGPIQQVLVLKLL